MKLVVGLGNPGNQYAKNRHNAGGQALDHFAQDQSLKFTTDKQTESLVAKLQKPGSGLRALLVKPQTFMNNSGQAVAGLANFYKLEPADIAVIYDELALPFGTVRLREGGSSAGHNGVASIIKTLGDEFIRIRIGIANQQASRADDTAFVLSDFNKLEQDHLPAILDYVDMLIVKFCDGQQMEPHTEIIDPKNK